MRWIYISPHLDDAILSVGGLIYEQVCAGSWVEIWTMFCGFPPNEDLSPIARSLHIQWGFHSAEETMLARREENRLAAKIVGAHIVDFNFLDCIYRRGIDGKWLYSNTFASPSPEDAEMRIKMTKDLADRLNHDDELVGPLAIGGHVDHVITRYAVDKLGHKLWYYADIPYLFNRSSEIKPIKKTMQTQRQRISGKGLIAWQDAVSAYTSQIRIEFETEKKMRKAIAKYGRWGVSLWSWANITRKSE